MRLLRVFFAVALVAAGGAWGQKVWDGKTDSEWYWENEQQTEFTISTAAQLAGLAQLVNGGNDFSGKTIKLTANIMLNDTANWRKWSETKPANAWTPIGNGGHPFYGTFDGGGKVISGVYISSSDNFKGLFGYAASGSVIKNLGVVALYVSGGYENCVGGLVGSNEGGTITDCYVTGNVSGNTAGGLACWNSGTITNSYAMGNVNHGTAGGLVGKNEGGTIADCYAAGNVNASYVVGGLVGRNGGIITNSYATGNAGGGYANNCTGGSVHDGTVGGLVGENEGGTIANSYATGNVKCGIAGGLVGNNSNKSTIENSYAMGNVTGGNAVGGLVGSNDGTITACYAAGNAKGNAVGGLAGSNEGIITNSYSMGNVAGSISGGLVGKLANGYSEKGTIKNSYSVGNVNGTTSANGGLVGENGKGTIVNSYYDRQTSSQSDIVKGEPKSTAQMKQQAIFNGWDFDCIWKMDEKNNGYPYLQSSEKSLPVKYKYPGKVQQGLVLTDKRDGKKYKTVIINNQTWMAENLNYNAKSSKCYGEGEKGWDGKPRYSAKETQANCTKYGRLYDWKTALKACPSGWHLPTLKEWNELNDYADMYLDGSNTHLKATSGWDDYQPCGQYHSCKAVSGNGTDDFGFAALPGGYGGTDGFGGVGGFSSWWSSSESDNGSAYHRDMYYTRYGHYGKFTSFSVRCLQD
ncbi:MAG: hypothetical protein LBH25_12400 [Fibromonadaceae bacterium]|nr:hypothetical protein [Fibromonadaceae bacterium]